MKRLDKAAAILEVERDPRLRLIICGGKRQNPNSSEAAVAARYFLKKFPELKNRLLPRRAESTYTAGDMVDLGRFLEKMYPKDTTIKIVTHPDHARFARITLEEFGWTDVRCLPSGEDAPYSNWQFRILNFAYRFDPTWEKFLSWPLRRIANRRGRDE